VRSCGYCAASRCGKLLEALRYLTGRFLGAGLLERFLK